MNLGFNIALLKSFESCDILLWVREIPLGGDLVEIRRDKCDMPRPQVQANLFSSVILFMISVVLYWAYAHCTIALKFIGNLQKLLPRRLNLSSLVLFMLLVVLLLYYIDVIVKRALEYATFTTLFYFGAGDGVVMLMYWIMRR